MATEQQIQKQIITYLQSLGGYVVKVITANHSGVADVHCCLNGNRNMQIPITNLLHTTHQSLI